MPLSVSHLAYEVFQAGYWFRVDGDRLYVIARRPELPPLPPDVAERVRGQKAGIIAAVRIIPDGCPARPGHLYAGRCVQSACVHLEAVHD